MVEETKKEENPTPEELEKEKREEEELLATPDATKVRSQVIEKYGLDEDVDTELIDKIVKENLEDRKKFGKLVGQKRGWREKAQKKPEKEKEKEPPEKEKDKPKFITEEDLDERDRKRDLESLEVSDELKKEVETYVKIHRCSVKEAFDSKYIKFLKEQEDKKAEEDDASIEGKHKTRTGKLKKKVTKEKFTADSFDLETEEGRKAYEEWKKGQEMV